MILELGEEIFGADIVEIGRGWWRWRIGKVEVCVAQKNGWAGEEGMERGECGVERGGGGGGVNWEGAAVTLCGMVTRGVRAECAR